MKKIDFIKGLVALCLIGSFSFMLYALVFIGIPEGNKELFIHAEGMIDTAFVGMLVAFYYTRSHKGGQDDPTT